MVHGVTPNFGAETPVGSTAAIEREILIKSGRAAIWTTHGPVPVFVDRGRLNTGVAPLPIGPGDTSGAYLTASGYFISARRETNPDVRQACWEWITFLSGQPKAVQGLPARRSVAESEAYRRHVGAERALAYLASIADSEQASALYLFSEEAWLNGAVYWLYQAYDQVVVGEVSVEEALAAAQELADDYRACVVTRDAFPIERGGRRV